MKTTTGFGLCIFVGGIFLGNEIGHFSERPYSISFKDVNRDGKEDVVVEAFNSRETFFLNKGNGTYIELNKYEQERRNELESEIDKMREGLYNPEIKVYNEGEEEK